MFGSRCNSHVSRFNLFVSQLILQHLIDYGRWDFVWLLVLTKIINKTSFGINQVLYDGVINLLRKESSIKNLTLRFQSVSKPPPSRTGFSQPRKMNYTSSFSKTYNTIGLSNLSDPLSIFYKIDRSVLTCIDCCFIFKYVYFLRIWLLQYTVSLYLCWSLSQDL